MLYLPGGFVTICMMYGVQKRRATKFGVDMSERRSKSSVAELFGVYIEHIARTANIPCIVQNRHHVYIAYSVQSVHTVYITYNLYIVYNVPLVCM